jgi:hypothetical protein
VLLALVEEGPAARLVFGLTSAAIMLTLAGQALADRRQAPVRSLVVLVTVLAYLTAQYHVLAVQAYQTLAWDLRCTCRCRCTLLPSASTEPRSCAACIGRVVTRQLSWNSSRSAFCPWPG